MSQMSQKRKAGFSLVELVIVIVIIGVIAAIAIPRVSRGSRSAGESSLASNLAVLRNAIELYASEHNGVYPAGNADGSAAAKWTPQAVINQLTRFSDLNGNTSPDRVGDFQFGPYLRKGIPPLPVGDNHGKSTVKIDKDNSPPVVDTASGDGWVYNPLTGDIIANADNTNEAGDKTYDQY
jgi:general secretion pathway protein G